MKSIRQIAIPRQLATLGRDNIVEFHGGKTPSAYQLLRHGQ